ncbi:transglycosylase SLT domain-containing protein [Rhizobium sp. TRM95111]|uniref:lytic transglycosylase domain-containing protein n=1 Tax=Rhizobium alarense TaxID=2846851 RepID=UPI001F30D680|nr:transglycosylase SLT domain-containing protein [Rhizobium alarense]MCF3642337.1 transglycosylase SLT domain-containing protein [Rhizobium alarense]
MKPSRPALAAALLAAGLAPSPAAAQPEFRAPPPCLYQMTPQDGPRLCIREATFGHDICSAIEHFSIRHDLPPGFFARLIWRESLFRPDAVSPKGAEGIAQFMPATARRRGLDDSFHALQALSASAAYLAALRRTYGNLGLAAAAYNAGEAGVERFIANGRLPFETRAYVMAITGHAAESWTDETLPGADFRLDADTPFRTACIALSERRRLKEIVYADEGEWAPWGIQLAAHFDKAVARRLFLMAVARLPAPLDAEKPLIRRERNARFGSRARYTARIGRESRAEAEAVCASIRRSGGACIVFRN